MINQIWQRLKLNESSWNFSVSLELFWNKHHNKIIFFKKTHSPDLFRQGQYNPYLQRRAPALGGSTAPQGWQQVAGLRIRFQMPRLTTEEEPPINKNHYFNHMYVVLIVYIYGFHYESNITTLHKKLELLLKRKSYYHSICNENILIYFSRHFLMYVFTS